jgi:hypothetical protein
MTSNKRNYPLVASSITCLIAASFFTAGCDNPSDDDYQLLTEQAEPGEDHRFLPTEGASALRREAFFAAYAQKPFPKDGPWLPLGQAQLAYWRNEDAKANADVVAWAAEMRDSTSELARLETVDFHWRAFHWARLGLLFGKHGVHRPGAMSPEAEQALKEILWDYVRTRASAEILDPANDWKLWKSENHHLQAWASLWASLQLLGGDPEFRGRALHDGSTVAEAKKAIDAYFKRWIRNRAATGLFVEANSPTYTKYSLGGFYNMADLANDAELRQLAREFLDLFWTQWALEQVEGVRGGSRHRSYAGGQSIVDDGSQHYAWYIFDLPGKPPMHPAAWIGATSSYYPPAFLVNLFGDRKSLGAWQSTTRLPGLLDPSRDSTPNFTSDPSHPFHNRRGVNHLDPTNSSILRQTYSTPDFVSGFSMVKPLPKEEWSGMSSQNRWDGVVFSGKDAPRIFFQPALLQRGTGSHYNANWSVADKGAAIVQRLPGSDAVDQRVFFSTALEISESHGWIFAESDAAYVALRVIDGGWRWEDDHAELWREKNKFRPGLGRWLVAENWSSPIVFEVARKTDFESFGAFRQSVKTNPLDLQEGVLEYRSQHYDTLLSLPIHQQSAPRVNGQPIDYENSPAYAGDVLVSDQDADHIIFQSNGTRHEFDFGPKAVEAVQ